MSGGLAALQAAIVAEGGELAAAALEVEELHPQGESPAAEAARGPRAAADPAQYELLLELIREGSLLHYGRPRVLRVDDPDLALLLGDRLYALGLQRLAALGDVEAVGRLGDTISALAEAYAEGRTEDAEEAWARGAAAVGWGGPREGRGGTL